MLERYGIIMDNSIIVPGVGAGGLQDKYEIKILICYLLNSINTPFSREQFNIIFQDTQSVNYFSFCDALAELLETNHISSEKLDFDEIFTLNELGKETALKLNRSLPKSLRDNLVDEAMKLLAKIKNQQENESEIVPYKNGFLVKCVIHDVDFDLMKFEVYAPDMLQAQKIKTKFQEKPSLLYKGLIQILVENSY